MNLYAHTLYTYSKPYQSKSTNIDKDTRIFKAINYSWNTLAFKEFPDSALIKISNQNITERY